MSKNGKPPKEPRTFRYPRMYGFQSNLYRDAFRLRIIEPDGKSEFFDMFQGFPYDTPPCWWREGMTGKEAVKAMKAYDEGYENETIFIGEIK